MDPIEPMVASGSKTLGILPRYHWAPDGTSILITQGGKLRRLDVATGQVATIPFTANVHRTHLADGAQRVPHLAMARSTCKLFRWPTTTPDGRLIAFQAVGRIWVQDAERRHAAPHARRHPSPRSSTRRPGAPMAAASRSSRSTTHGRGHVWKVPATGGAPERLSQDPGDYVDPVWSPDGRCVIVARGEGATARGRTMTHNAWFDLVRFDAGRAPPAIPASRSPPSSDLPARPWPAEPRRQLARPSIGPEGRIFWIRSSAPAPKAAGRGGTALMSVDPDGSDKQEHLSFPAADEIVPSPTRRLGRIPGRRQRLRRAHGVGRHRRRPAAHREARAASSRSRQLSRDGGMFPHWRDGTTLEFGSGPHFFVHHMDTAGPTPARSG